MDSKNPIDTKKTNAPHGLPVLDEEKIKTHTMQDDLLKIKDKDNPATSISSKENLNNLQNKTTPTQSLNLPKKPQKNIENSSIFDKFKKPKNTLNQAPNTKIDLSKFKNTSEKTTNNIPKPPKPPTKQIPQNTNNLTPPNKKDELKDNSGLDITEKNQNTTNTDSLDIKIPNTNNNKIIIVILSFIVLVIIFVIYFFLTSNKNTENKNTANVKENNSPEIIKIPETKPPKKDKREIKKEIKEVKIPEPTLPVDFFNIKQSVVTEVSETNKLQMIKSIYSDSLQIPGDGTIRRHLVKLSNDKEKRFLESREALSFLEIEIPSSILEKISNIEIVSYKIGKDIRYGIIAKTDNKKDIISILDTIDLKNTITKLRQLFMGELITLPENPVFAKNTYLDFEKRYINLPDSNTSLDIAVSDKYFIIATSKDMIFASILQVAPKTTK